MPLGGLAPCPFPLGGNRLTGWTAEQHARLAADLRACVRTVPFAVVFVSDNAVQFYTGQHAIGISVAPTITVNGAGDVDVTWNSSYTDAYDNAWPIKLKWAKATAADSAAIFANVTLNAANEVRVVTSNAAGTPTDSSFTLVVA
jgi:hypothetical protein